MKWYEDLFVGESVTGKIKKIKWKIEHNAGMLHTYIITFPSNEENLLDIIPTRELLQKGYPKKNLHIIAVAVIMMRHFCWPVILLRRHTKIQVKLM